jgi:hypothetical protein
VSGRKSIRADKVSPRKSKRTLQMVDVKGFPLRSELGPDLVTDKESYDRREYEYKRSTPVILDSDSYKTQGYSTGNALSKGLPAALPIIEQFPEQSEVSRTLLGINRETTQQSLFSNVSVYGLDSKDWEVKISGYRDGNNRWWTRRPSLSGNYGPSVLKEDDRNAALRITSNPTPYLEPRIPTADRPFTSISQSILWGQYINTIVAMYIFKYMVKNFSREKKLQYNLNYLSSLYPTDSSGSFNDLAWDKIWLDINQNRFGSNPNNYPLIPKVQAFNFKNVFLNNSRSPQLWGSSSVIIQEANLSLPSSIDFSWDKENFSVGRMFFPDQRSDNKGHFYIKTNPDPQVWQKYFGLRWNEIKPEIRNWEFTVHESEDTVTDIEKQLKLPYVIIENTPQRFNSSWPNASETNLPVDGNRIGGSEGIDSGILLKSVRSFRYQPGRISGFTYGVKLSEIGAGPGTTIEFGIENKTDSYMFRLTNGGSFSIVRRSVVPLDDTLFLSDAKYLENTKTVVVDGEVQYETAIGQNIMNGDPLSGEGESGYILDPDTVTMFKIEFGWYGAIGAKFYAYVPFGNNECRWVTLHTLVIENQLKRPCLGDPFFYFTYKLNIQDSRTVRLEQFLDKFGASYYIDGYDEGNSLPQSISSGVRSLERNIGGSDIRISPLDWTTLIGLKPRRFVTNASGEQILNKKEIYPQSVNISSSTDCEIKIIRQKGCPEFAYNHQEGYRWQILPESRRLRARFSIIPYFELDLPSLGIIRSNKSTHTAIAAYSTESSGNFRDPRIEQNWGVIGEQPIRILANDVFGVFSDRKSFEGGSVILNLKRPRPYRYLSSRLGLGENIDTVKLPFTYASIAPNELGYNLEIDYFRRDQILLSTVDINSNEFYIYWTGGRMQGPNPGNFASMRFGFCWPNVTNPESPIYAEASSSDWGIEEGPLEYDGENFYEGLPYDFVQDYSNNCLYIETGSEVWYNTYGLEIQEEDFFLRRFTNLDPDFSLSVPGVEGGTCRGLFCKYGRELRDQVVIISEYDAEQDVTNYYISDPNSPWPNLSPKNYTVTILQGGTKVNIETTGGITRIVNDAILYLIPIGETLPEGLAEGFAKVYYSVIYIARMNQDSQVIEILASEIAPGDIPFVRVFIQARQGAQLGGVWVGQKTSEGIKVNPFTPHRSTLSISDDGIDFHGQWSSVPETDGALKVIAAYQQDQTAPTIDASEDSLQTFKSIHSSPKKCGSFTFPGGTSSAGVFIGSEYPLRSFTQPSIGVPVTTYYVSANTPTQIDLSSVFYVGGEGITSNSFGDVATFVVGRSLDASGDVQISLNYIES